MTSTRSFPLCGEGGGRKGEGRNRHRQTEGREEFERGATDTDIQKGERSLKGKRQTQSKQVELPLRGPS
jgi:hypothetical protein